MEKVGTALDKLGEAFSWIKSQIVAFSKYLFQELKQSFTWLKSKIEDFLRYLTKKIQLAFSRLKRFYDNFSECFKDTLVTTRAAIVAAMQKIAKIMAWSFEEDMNERQYESVMISLVEQFEILYKSLNQWEVLMKAVDLKTVNRCRSSETFKMMEELVKCHDQLVASMPHDLQKILFHEPMEAYKYSL